MMNTVCGMSIILGWPKSLFMFFHVLENPEFWPTQQFAQSHEVSQLALEPRQFITLCSDTPRPSGPLLGCRAGQDSRGENDFS